MTAGVWVVERHSGRLNGAWRRLATFPRAAPAWARYRAAAAVVLRGGVRLREGETVRAECYADAASARAARP